MARRYHPVKSVWVEKSVFCALGGEKSDRAEIFWAKIPNGPLDGMNNNSPFCHVFTSQVQKTCLVQNIAQLPMDGLMGGKGALARGMLRECPLYQKLSASGMS